MCGQRRWASLASEVRLAAKHKYGAFVETHVKGVRADLNFWDSVDEVAKREKTTRNNLIVRVMIDYIMRYDEKEQ